ncbi:MAG: hypothetical protein KIT09_18150 [Bryobacteraceae bacterium]|nr:hypothetical protein [Bryobacteraceae bacterium]
MTGIEFLIGSSLYHLAKPVVEAALPGLTQGVLANRLDGALCLGFDRTWRAIRSMDSSDPLNHDLQHAARRAYLRACEEMAEQAGFSATAATIREERKRVHKEIPARPLGELDVLLLDRETAPERRTAAFQHGLTKVLAADLDRWLPLDPRRKTLDRLARDGWRITDKRRDLQGVMTLWFWEEIKENHRAREIFQTQMLAELANREPALKPLADIKEFERRFDSFADQLGRIEHKLDEIPEKVADELERRGLARRQGPFSRLDARPQGFVERRESLDWLERRLFAGTAPSLLWGEPGSGKSTLALELGWRLFEDGRFSTVVQQFCGPARALGVVGPELAAVLPNYNREAEPKVQMERARQWLSERGALLILDDVWDESVLDLTPGPPARVIYTSRRPSLGRLTADQVRQVSGFDVPETEEMLEKRLPGWLAGHGPALRRLAARVEHLPYALDVAAGLLQKGRRPRAQQIEYVEAVALRSNNALYVEAASAHKPEARRLLNAVALCLPEGVWLPFAAELAGLEGDAVWEHVEALVDASLLRTIDRDEQLYGMHMVLRDVLAAETAKLEEARVKALERMFGEWNSDRSRWRDCARVLAETEPAVEWLARAGDSRFPRLSWRAFEFGRLTGQLVIANRLIERRQAFYERKGDRHGLQASYGNQALILQDWGKLEEAMALHQKQEALCHELGNKDGLQASYGNQALILQAWGKLEEAMALHKKEEALCLELGNKDGLSRSYGNQALILQDWGKLEEAMALHKKEEALCLELGNRASLAYSYWNQGLLLRQMNQLEEGREALEKGLEIFTALGMPRERDAVRRALDEMGGKADSAGQR